MNLKKQIEKCFLLYLGTVSLICAFTLAACGDKSTGAKDKDASESTAKIVETKDDLPKCSSNSEGDRFYVEDEGADFLCGDGEWIVLSGEDSISSSGGVNSSASAESSSSSDNSILESCTDGETSVYDGIPVTCQDNRWYATGVEFGILKDDRDGNTYKTVKIGDQTWMAENLNYAYKGVPYNYVYNGREYEYDSTSWCYEGDPGNCDTYGRLYTWSAVMDSAGVVDAKNKVANLSESESGCGYGVECFPNIPHRGICPEGWHVPTTAEFDTLYTNIGGKSDAGVYLKSTDKWKGKTSTRGVDLYGFVVLPAGNRSVKGSFGDLGFYAQLWNASEYSTYYAYHENFNYDNGGVLKENIGKYYGYSLRCLRDSE